MRIKLYILGFLTGILIFQLLNIQDQPEKISEVEIIQIKYQ